MGKKQQNTHWRLSSIEDERDDISHSNLGLPFQESSNGVPMTSSSKILLSTFTGMK
jgi:hypothetical protein